MLKPQILFVGPAKTGTSWVHEYLAERGDVSLPQGVKETFFFDKYTERGLSWYRSQFDQKPESNLTTEVAPSYSDFPETAQKIVQYLPDVRVIMTLRDPVARTMSQYWHWQRYGLTDRLCADLLESEPLLLRPSRYAELLKTWQETLGPDRVDVLIYEDLTADPQSFVRQLCLIAGLPFIPPSDDLLATKSNARAVPRSPAIAKGMASIRKVIYDLRLANAAKLLGASKFRRLLERDPEASDGGQDTSKLRTQIYQALADDIYKVEAMLGRDFPTWHLNKS